MKKTTFTLLLALFCWRLAAQCPTGDVIFNEQWEIDNFPVNYPNCTKIDGSLSVFVSQNANLEGLQNIDTIGGSLIIRYTDLDSLIGLDSLRYIGGGLSLDMNYSMTSLSGIENIDSLGGLNIYDNPSLLTLCSWANLKSIPFIAIYNNDNLINLNGLDSVEQVEYFVIVSGPSLTSIEGLGNLKVIGEELAIERTALQSLHGLEKLNSITGLALFDNDSLISLSALSNVSSFGGHLRVQQNNSLVNLNGLENFVASGINYLTLSENPNLAICEIPPICAYLQNGGPATISDNAPGCNSVLEIEAACIVSVGETSTGEPAILFSPSPARDFLQIQINNSENWEITLYDLQGRQMFRQSVSGSQIIGVKDWPSGIYALRAVSGRRVFAGKIVKQ